MGNKGLLTIFNRWMIIVFFTLLFVSALMCVLTGSASADTQMYYLPEEITIYTENLDGDCSFVELKYKYNKKGDVMQETINYESYDSYMDHTYISSEESKYKYYYRSNGEKKKAVESIRSSVEGNLKTTIYYDKKGRKKKVKYSLSPNIYYYCYDKHGNVYKLQEESVDENGRRHKEDAVKYQLRYKKGRIVRAREGSYPHIITTYYFNKAGLAVKCYKSNQNNAIVYNYSYNKKGCVKQILFEDDYMESSSMIKIKYTKKKTTKKQYSAMINKLLGYQADL